MNSWSVQWILLGQDRKSFFSCHPTAAKVDQTDPKHFHVDLEWIATIHNTFHIDIHISHYPAASLTTGRFTHFCCWVQTLHLQCTYSYMVRYLPATCIPIAMLCTWIYMYLCKPQNRNKSLGCHYFVLDASRKIQISTSSSTKKLPCSLCQRHEQAPTSKRTVKTSEFWCWKPLNIGFSLFSYSQTKLAGNMTSEP